MKYKILVLFYFIFVNYLLNSQVLINEVSSVNYDVLIDDDNDRPDWIEIYNAGDFPVSLDGWKIFDRDNINNAWTFPNIELKAKERRLIYASGKNKTISNKFVLEAAGQGIFPHSRDDSYKFQYTELTGDFEFSVRVHTLRNAAEFGSTGVIVREDLTNTNRFYGVFSQRSDRPSCEFLFRDDPTFEYRYPKRIYSTTEAIYPDLVLSVSRKGDSITAAIKDIEGYILEKNTMFWDFPESVFVGIALSSSNHNYTAKASYSELIVNQQSFGFERLKTAEYDLLSTGNSYFSKDLHTNFSLSRSGESLYLWDASGKLVDKVDITPMYVDMSYSRIPDGSKTWSYTQPPTPNSINENSRLKILKQPVFSLEPKFYNSEQTLKIVIPDLNAKCYYTLDGSEPDENSKLYNGETIYINQTTVVKARVYQENCIPSQIETATYFINEFTADLPVVSISTNSEYFFDEQIGQFPNPHYDYEYPISFEFFDTNLTRVFVNRTGFKTHGHGAALDEQTSLRFNAKSKYGESDFNYPFFDYHGLNYYDKLVIRNSGQDRFGAFIRDALVSVIGMRIDKIEGTAYKPVLTYINGEFWGLYNLRERFDEQLLEGRYSINKNSISLMEPVYRLMSGASKTYREILSKLPEANPDSVLSILDEVIDIDNFINYNALSFWANNSDWPQHNFKLWRSNELDNKWRWILMDFDLSLNFDYTNIYRVNHFKNSMDSASKNPELYHLPSILFNSFKNIDFRNKYLIHNCDLLNSTLNSTFLTPLFDSLINNISKAVPIQIARWEKSIPLFSKHVDMIRTYFIERPKYYREHLREYFNLSGISKIDIKSNIENACTFNINTLNNLESNWSGYYFNEVPIKITYNRNIGYKFRYWMIGDSHIIVGDTLEVTPSDSIIISAIFENVTEPIPGSLVINEIMYKAASDINSDDWIEFYNPGDFDLDISNWLLKDDNNSRHFTIPSNTILKSRSYLVIVEKRSNFKKVYPSVNNLLGEFTFGFGTDDMVRVYDNLGYIQDSVKYTNKAPWYPEADGMGPSLELIDPLSDNSLASSWRVSLEDGGSPGESNTVVGVLDNYYDNIAGEQVLKVYPNPIQMFANLDFRVEQSGNTEIIINDLFGNPVRNLLNGFYDMGDYSSYWDGKDNQGRTVARGMYIITIKSNNKVSETTIIVD